MASSLLLPRGYMPASDSQGSVRVMVCTGMGPAAMTMVIPFEKDSQDRDSRDGRQPDKSCIFAGNSAPLAGGGNAPLVPPPAWFDLPPGGAPTVSLAPGRGMAAPPPPSQAPPIALI